MIGEEIRRQREALGLTGAQLAAKAGMAPSAVSQIETGKRTPSSTSVLKLAYALGVEVGELYPKGQAPLPELVEERRAGWDTAVHNARQLRERGRARMEELLSSWRDKHDRRALREMGQLLQEAYDTETALVRNLEEESTGRIRLDLVPITEWEEVRRASRFYGALLEMIQGAGLHVRTEGRAHEVKDAA
jgi:transcriptional regulator with XRE-family HTH domain